ncbi:heavy metal-binding domain-containing protein [Pedobacter fastidiosus]|uniref:heavy metal-binding domain-containing protein n=1 Tax=Pedobacter fastidiosus TaxID=2765361 RepID=UPI00361DE65B
MQLFIPAHASRIKESKPGKCPKCGMALVKKKWWSRKKRQQPLKKLNQVKNREWKIGLGTTKKSGNKAN